MSTSIPTRVVIATRGSDLALWQSRWVQSRLLALHPGITVELRILKTTGDRFLNASLQAIGGKGAFTKEITEAVLRGEADVAVHSLKDLPTRPEPGLRVWAYPPRFDSRDAWIGRDGLRYDDLWPGARVATGSLRRVAQLKHRHPGAQAEPIRGNLDTRLRKFDEGSMAGMFLAVAGLERLGWGGRITEKLAPDVFLPAPGQGALAVEGRDDAAAEALLAPLNDPDTRDAVAAERAFLAELEAGCQIPVAAGAVLDGASVTLDGLVASLDGARVLRGTERGPRADAASLGRSLARRLVERGADRILAEARESEGRPEEPGGGT
jgi:hydroxymethylbilane synthase